MIAALGCVPGNGLMAQDIGRLYAKRPPPGMAYVRIIATEIIPSTGPIEMNGTNLPVEPAAIANRYRVVRANDPVKIAVGGIGVAGTITLQPERFYTVALVPERGVWSSRAMDEGQGSVNDLKAELRFFNLVRNCKAVLKIADGPVVFDLVDAFNFKSRSINPVEAELQASCGDQGSSLKLPKLRSGDHYSLFLTEAAAKLSLTGQFDETEPYRE